MSEYSLSLANQFKLAGVYILVAVLVGLYVHFVTKEKKE